MRISELWYSKNEEDWNIALNEYDKKVDSDLEEYMDNITSEEVKTMGVEEFYEFLRDKYFEWKYKKNYFQRRLNDLAKHQSGDGKRELLKIKERFFELADQEKENTSKLLEELTKISGLGVAGASGLLSILYPEYYGTVDKFLVISLCLVDGFDKHDELLKIDVSEIKINKAVLLEEIIREKAASLTHMFKPVEEKDKWTPKKIDKVLWAYRDEHQIAYYNIEKAISANRELLTDEDRERLVDKIRGTKRK